MRPVRALRAALWRRVGRRGTTLLFLALVDAVYALSLAYPPRAALRTPTMRYLEGVAPLWLWAGMWAAVGAACAAGAFARRDRWAFVCAASLKVLWGTLFTAGWALSGLDRGWVSGTVWGSFAAFVYMVAGWPEPRGAGGEGVRP